MQFPIIKHAYAWIGTSLVIMAVGLWLFFAHMRLSIQFTGGMEIVVKAPEISQSVVDTLTKNLQATGINQAQIVAGKKDAYGSLLVQMVFADDKQINTVSSVVEDTLKSTQVISSKDDVLELSVIGPSVGDYMKKSAKYAIIVGIILMAVYILFSFSEMRMFVSPALLGAVTVATLLFDVTGAAGGYGFLMRVNPAIQIDTVFIIALLTVMGYSINDTIIIFDRVRENFLDKKQSVERGTMTYAAIFEMSLWQTMRRSLGTSITTIAVIVCMYIFGTGVLRLFAFTMGIGVIAGTYSSIFFAAPMAYLVSNYFHHQAKKAPVSHKKK